LLNGADAAVRAPWTPTGPAPMITKSNVASDDCIAERVCFFLLMPLVVE